MLIAGVTALVRKLWAPRTVGTRYLADNSLPVPDDGMSDAGGRAQLGI